MTIRACGIRGGLSTALFAAPAIVGLGSCSAPDGDGREETELGRSVSAAVARADFQDASGRVRVRVKTCDPVASHFESVRGKNVAVALCPVDAGWAMVGGGAEIIGEGTPGALLKASLPNPTDSFTSWVARSSDTRMPNGSQAFPHELRAYVIGLQLVGPNGVPFAPAIIAGQDAVNSEDVANPTATSFLGPEKILIGGGAEVLPNVLAEESLFPDLFLVESRRVGNAWRATAKNNQTGDVGSIKAYAIGIDACPAGFGRCLAFSRTDAASGSAAGYVAATASVTAPWAITSIGGLAEQGGGAGRYFTDLVPLNGMSQGFSVRTKDQGGSDAAVTRGMALKVAAPLPATITVGTGCTFQQALTTVNTGQAVGSCAAPSGVDTIRLNATPTPHVVSGINLDVLRSVTISGAGSGVSTLEFSGGVTGNNDAGLRVLDGAFVTIRDITLRGANGNQLSGVKSIDSFLTLSNARITNFGYAGVHVLDFPSSAAITGSTIDGNGVFGAGPLGGGILNFGTLSVDTSTISNNFAFEGGGIANFGDLTVTASTFEGNDALMTGGGLHNESDGAFPVAIVNSTFTGNTAGDGGGGGVFAAFYGDSSALFGLIQNTIVLNEAQGPGGGIHIHNTSERDINVPFNNIVANNTAGTAGEIFSDAIFPLALANNLVGDPAGVIPAVTCAAPNECPNPATCQHPICGDPRLGPLESVNNRPRSYTLLASGPPSPAIDAAIGGETFDQRGQPRPIDGNRDGSSLFDFGAVEYDPNVQLFGFEAVADWSSPAALSLDAARKTQGLVGLRVGGSGFRTVTSAPLRTPPAMFSSTLRLDFFLPPNQPNSFWFGAVQMHASCPSAGVVNAYLGQVELTGKPTNQFSTLAFPLTSQVSTMLGQAHTDCYLSISLNTNATPISPVLDNLRFTP
jgi:hypothetical protein